MIFFFQPFGLFLLLFHKFTRALSQLFGSFYDLFFGLIDDYLREGYVYVVCIEQQLYFAVHVALYLIDVLLLALGDEEQIDAGSAERGHALVVGTFNYSGNVALYRIDIVTYHHCHIFLWTVLLVSDIS